jgi:hypothetical protein
MEEWKSITRPQILQVLFVSALNGKWNKKG